MPDAVISLIIFDVVVVAVVFISLKLYMRRFRCPHCHKANALEFVEEITVDEKMVSREVSRDVKDKSGNVIGTTKQTVYGTRRVIDRIYRCRFCSKIVIRRVYRDV